MASSCSCTRLKSVSTYAQRDITKGEAEGVWAGEGGCVIMHSGQLRLLRTSVFSPERGDPSVEPCAALLTVMRMAPPEAGVALIPRASRGEQEARSKKERKKARARARAARGGLGTWASMPAAIAQLR